MGNKSSVWVPAVTSRSVKQALSASRLLAQKRSRFGRGQCLMKLIASYVNAYLLHAAQQENQENPDLFLSHNLIDSFARPFCEYSVRFITARFVGSWNRLR